MAKSKPPYFCFYPSDFVSDPKVMAMSAAAVGAYIRLLCAAWSESPPGSVPNDDRVLARLTGMTPDEWRDVRPEVEAAFERGTDGRLHQKRLRQEYEAFVEKSKARADAGKKGGRPKNQKESNCFSHEKHRAYGSGSGSSPSGESEGGDPPGFTRWWKSYPGKKTQKQRCLAIWRGKKPTADGQKRELEPLADTICEALERQKQANHWRGTDGRDFIPNAPTWLYNGNWEDEVDTSSAGSDAGDSGLVDCGPVSEAEARRALEDTL